MSKLTKSELVTTLADKLKVSKADVNHFFDALSEVIHKEVKKGNAVVIPDLVKVYVKAMPARPARQGRNPMTGETITIKAKPASKAVKVKPVKQLKSIL